LENFSNHNLSKEELVSLVNEQTKELAKLQNGTNKFKSFFNSSINGRYKSTPDGKFIEVNTALVDMLGYETEEELLEIDIISQLYFDSNDRESSFEVQDSEDIKMYHFRKKNGTSIWVEDYVKSIRDEAGNIIHYEGILKDVSERKKRKVLLKISEEGYKIHELKDFNEFIMNELGQLIDTTNFYIAFFNENRETISIPFIAGEDADEEFPIGKSMTGYLIKKGKPLFVKSKEYKRLIDSGTIELIGTFPKVWLGVPLSVNDKVMGAIVVQSYNDEGAYQLADVELLEFVSSHISLAVQRKKIEQEIAVSKQVLRKVLDNIPIKVFWKDRDSKFLGCNKSSLKEMNIENEEDVIGKSDFDFHEKEDAKKYRDDEDAIMRSGVPKLNYQETQIKKGKEHIYITSKLPFYDEKDNVIGLVGTSDDITEQKEIEVKLKKAIEEANAANLSKSTFLSNMSHEIRTPMNAILGYSQLLQDDDNLTKVQQENLRTINRSGEHLLELINDILDMSKIEAGRVSLKQTDFSFIELLKEVEQLFKLKAEQKHIEFSFKLDEKIPKAIVADESKIKQVIINLIGNALKFTSTGFVKVTVETGTNNLMFVKVKDSGKGILKEEQETVFKPFEQAQKGAAVKGGTGLGLAISKKLASLMEGDIEVESELGNGAEFIFSFNYLEGEESKLEENIEVLKVEALSPEMKGFKVAIVDDRFENRDILFKKLDPLGFATQMAENGQEAVDLYKEWKPDIILMDVVMPVMDGVEATRQILEIAGDHDVKIFVVSASALESEQKEIMELGATIFIKKPVKFDELLAEMHDKAGVQFIYQNKQSEVKEEGVSVTPADVPEDFKSKLLNAADEGDFMLLQDLVAALEKETNKPFKIIEDYIDEMEFEAIVNWLES